MRGLCLSLMLLKFRLKAVITRYVVSLLFVLQGHNNYGTMETVK